MREGGASGALNAERLQLKRFADGTGAEEVFRSFAVAPACRFA